MGTAPLSFSHRMRFSTLRSLQSHLGHSASDDKQHFFRAYLRPDFSDRDKMFQRKGCSLEFLSLGATPACYFLLHPLGLGTQPCRIPAGRDFFADLGDGRKRRVEAMAAIGLALGRRRADQHDSVVISSRLRLVDLVWPRQTP